MQQKATNVPPLKQITPHVIPPDIHRYPFRHLRHQQPAVISARYANATNHLYNLESNAVFNLITVVLQEFCHLIKRPDKEIWTKSLANEFGRLTQGVKNLIKGTNTMYFIPKEEVPFETKKVTYPKIVCDIRPNKEETHCTRITVRGNFLEFAGTLTTPNVTIKTTK